MWHLILAMLQACLAWHFCVCGQSLTPNSQCINSATVLHRQGRLNCWIYRGSSFGLVHTHTHPLDMTGGTTHQVRWKEAHRACLLRELQIFNGHWDTSPSTECPPTKSPGMRDLRPRLARVKTCLKVKPQEALSTCSILSVKRGLPQHGSQEAQARHSLTLPVFPTPPTPIPNIWARATDPRQEPDLPHLILPS